MAARNMPMIEVVTEKATALLTYGELTTTLQTGINTFLLAHITNILSNFIKDSITTAHITTRLQNHIKVDIQEICNRLAPYTQLNDLTEQHFLTNQWYSRDKFNFENIRVRLTRQDEKYSDVVNNEQMDRSIYKAYLMRVFDARQKRVYKKQ
jgi:hypothetical protein